MLKTGFWISAANSLPASVRARYLADFERAERWELALDAAVETCSRAKSALARSFRTQRHAAQ
jgi:hypothetical protein